MWKYFGLSCFYCVSRGTGAESADLSISLAGQVEEVFMFGACVGFTLNTEHPNINHILQS